MVQAVEREGKGRAAILAALRGRWGRLALLAVLLVFGAWAYSPAPHLLALAGGGTSTTIPYGATATLTADFSNGTGVIKDEGDATVVPNVVSLNSYTTAPLTQNKTYTLTVTNPAGDVVSASVSVTVTPVVISSITPANPSITVGRSRTFSASASGGVTNGITWSASAGTMNAQTGAWTAPATIQPVTITATSNDDGSVKAQTTVTLVDAASASISASTTTPLYGAVDVTVTPTFSGATSVIVGSYQGGNNISTAPVSGVAIPVMGGGFTSNITYWVRATNAIGDFTDASVAITPATVTVGALAPASTQATVGAYVSYTVPTVGGATNTAVTWWASGGSFTNIGTTVGSRVYWRAPMTPGTYSIHATAADNVTYSSASVTVVPHQTLTSFSAADATVPFGGSTTLTGSWSNGFGVIYPGVLTPASGSPVSTGSLTSSTTFTLYIDPTAPYSNLVPNGDGEDGNSTSGYPSSLLANDPANAYSGSWVRELTIPSGYVQQRAGDWTPANPGDQIRWCMWAKSGAAWSGNPVGLYIAWTDAAGNYLSGQYVYSGFVPTTTYQWYSVSGSVPAGAGGFYTTYEWNVSAGDVGKTLYVDDLRLTFEPTASVTVNVGSVSIAAGPNFYGGYVTRGKTAAMSATVSGAANSNVSWSADGGSFSVNPSASGANTVWTPPAANGAYNVRATSVADSSKVVTRTFTVVDPPAASLSVDNTNPPYGSSVRLTANFSGGTAVIGTNQGWSDISSNAVSGSVYQTYPIIGATGFWLRVTNQAGDYADSYCGTVTPLSVSVSAIAPAGASVTVGKTLPINAQTLGAEDYGVDWYVNGVNGGSSSIGVIDGRMLLANPSFDSTDSSNTGAAFWAIYNNTAAAEPATAQRLSSGGVDGGAFVRVSWSINNTSTKGILSVGDYGPNWGVAGGWKPFTTYRVTWWARGSGSNIGGWMANAWNVAPANTTFIKAPTLSDQWQQWDAIITTGDTVEPYGRLYTYLGSNTAGTLDFDKVSVREIPNSLNNWDFSAGTTSNWRVNWDPFGCDLGMNLSSTWEVAGMNTVFVHQNGILNQPNYYYELWSDPISITGGVSYRASAFTGAHRCRVGVYAFFFDAGGNFVGYAGDVANALNDQEAVGGVALTGYKWTYAQNVAPANAVTARFVIRKFDTAPGNTDSWLFFLLPKLEAVGGTGLYTAPSTPGTYTIQAVSDLKPSASSSTTVNVVSVPTASITASNTNPLYGESVSVTPSFVGSTAVVGTGNGTYFFGTSDISSNATSGAAINVGAATSTKTYYLRAWNAAGDNADASVTVTPQTVTISGISGGGGYLSAGYGRAMNATVSGAANGNVNWSASGGSFSPTTTGSGANTTWFAPATPGVYTIYATSAATGAQTSTTITVVALPTASLSATPGNPLYGAASGVTVSFSGGAAEVLGSYQGGANWNGGPLSSGAYYQITSSTTSGYTAWLRVTNAAGQYADASAAVTPQSVSIVKGNGSTSMLVNTGAAFSASVSGAANSSVSWSASGGSFSTTSTASGANTTWTAPATAGTYTVTASSAVFGSANTSWTVIVSSSSTPPTMSTFNATDQTISGGSDNYDCNSNLVYVPNNAYTVISFSGIYDEWKIYVGGNLIDGAVTSAAQTKYYGSTYYVGACSDFSYDEPRWGTNTQVRLDLRKGSTWQSFYVYIN